MSQRPVVLNSVREFARISGFRDQEDMEALIKAVSESFNNAVMHGYLEGERGLIYVSAHVDELGLEVIVKDQGAAFDMEGALACDISWDTGETMRGICLIRELVDEVELRSLGSGGKEIRLVKRKTSGRIEDYYSEEELKAFPHDNESGARRPPEDSEFTIGPLKPEEALEVSRCVYKSYGYSYALDHVYYPERIIKLNREGRMFSVVCRTPENDVAGHCALVFHGDDPKIGELAQAFVKPEFRSKGCFSKMNERLIDYAKSIGLLGLYGQAVTNHTYSQRMGLSLGMKDCAIKLGYVPQTASFKGITDQLPQRDTLVIQYLFLRDEPSHPVFPPAHHAPMIADLIKEIGGAAFIQTPSAAPEPASDQRETISVEMMKTLNAGIIDIKQHTKGGVEDVRRILRDLCERETEIIHLYLDLNDPMTFFRTGLFEDMGFFFSGILPGHRSTDILILQYLNNLAMNYDHIKIESDLGNRLLQYIKNLDPNLP
jgi:serine/threonine-protein kinase RsbW